jgi:hypothetical protein
VWRLWETSLLITAVVAASRYSGILVRLGGRRTDLRGLPSPALLACGELLLDSATPTTIYIIVNVRWHADADADAIPKGFLQNVILTAST